MVKRASLCLAQEMLRVRATHRSFIDTAHTGYAEEQLEISLLLPDTFFLSGLPYLLLLILLFDERCEIVIEVLGE